mgnify:CR=1 FL=1
MTAGPRLDPTATESLARWAAKIVDRPDGLGILARRLGASVVAPSTVEVGIWVPDRASDAAVELEILTPVEAISPVDPPPSADDRDVLADEPDSEVPGRPARREPQRRGDDHPVGVQVDPVAVAIVADDPLPERRDAERDRGLALGADAYVTKPFSTRELVAQIEEVLAKK